MRFASFQSEDGPRFGLVVDGGIVDLTGRLDPAVMTLRAAIAAGVLDKAAAFAGRSPDVAMADVTWLPVIPDPAKILCIGLNYETHRIETKRPEAAHPAVFLRFADSQIGHGQTMLRPRVSQKLDYEGEVAVIIGRGGRYIPEETALDHVAGYACYNDGSVRDWQRHTHQFTPGKTFPGTGGFGPWMLTAPALGDYRQLRLVTRLNGEVMQDSMLSHLIFPIPALIAYVSSFTPLSPGDVIVTGTPGGVGDRREPPVYMQPGDVVEVDIGPLGKLMNTVGEEPPAA
jgi:2-keto-4-pentenoate hydratase/2-oxohepta-3-ene-1,7-dioic acid hydratase in catechol pathway